MLVGDARGRRQLRHRNVVVVDMTDEDKQVILQAAYETLARTAHTRPTHWHTICGLASPSPSRNAGIGR